ncbi:uncharacterized protein LOC113351863 [Papaver somniferum]|uniref:uncharacterized protein LOC113351863 n=1 Tax=Papaver somniferum TaxID=3469 RepID=UPI000E6F6F56|nr:uncharacterized protein LOC113351863 [Papaver somniferum]
MFATSNVIDISHLFDDTSLYRITFGVLQYATVTRLGISSSVNKAYQKMKAPTEDDLTAVKRILRYLSGTLGYGLQFRRATSLHLQAYSDADWTGDYLDKRSTSGMVFLFGPNLISWCSGKQNTTLRSSNKYEYRALENVISELL